MTSIAFILLYSALSSSVSFGADDRNEKLKPTLFSKIYFSDYKALEHEDTENVVPIPCKMKSFDVTKNDQVLVVNVTCHDDGINNFG